ncbi:MAG: mechanosensitive ion channel family protein [Anaerolineales bacterium]|nr:mechanosensitive ion channel family protein [Anaerolineales bacterium]
MAEWMLWLQRQYNLRPQFYFNLMLSIAVLVGLWLLWRWILHMGTRKAEDTRVRYQWRKTTTYIYYISVAILLGIIWLGDLTNLATYLGLVSAGLAIALGDPITNIAGWIFIFWRRPFTVGDRIQIGEHAGDVIDVRIFQFTILEIGNWVEGDQSTGRMIHIPNRKVFSDPLANYSKGFQFIWNEIPVLITFESDWQKAKTILNTIISNYGQEFRQDVERQLQRTAQDYLIYTPTTTPIVYTDVKDSGVLLTIRYLCKPHERRTTTEVVWEEVLQAFEQHQDIQLAYPTTRFFDARLD